ncbi:MULTISPECIES: polysaccharide biosynthesis protein [unclassified Paracoccus (in: a-proteobacteria)]|uniref:polysaccharide biosynthesis protein n=1 Tax=unclassified Paracoccus (in: a-proteobacteria) TaxID=2688777 RepID=UPI001E29A5A8|nr:MULTISPECIES: polysaccharide biosynthesis protein [unclassified Paracoccus (in: a-proteobacteria)]UXU74424.1 polysaccharide biosynthesis protein [Paracoccus sp. SMMA_5]UXU80314.1 polysaccharide biosynthesis protein [Paracoccus sp. SMMA_5_TC]
MTSIPDMNLDWLASRIVGRAESFFARDMHAAGPELAEMIGGARILFIGGAGSIGFQTLRSIAHFGPRALHVVDHNENGLAELVRALRSGPTPLRVDELLTMPIDYGGDAFRLWLRAQSQPYDYVLNFAALKHVRSEKDPYSILAMLDTNVLKLARLSRLLAGQASLKRLFCVSTDKAANPSSMMGATKRLMEHAMFSQTLDWPAGLAITSARFANVALSNGSLLQSWENRLALRQPMACPEGCRRFFVALPESGHLCTLAGLLGDHGNIMVPALAPESHLMLLQDVAGWFLEAQGLAPHFTRDESEAVGRVEELAAQGKWPVLLTPLDTAGEKPYEEFVGANETVHPTRFASLQRVPYLPPADAGSFPRLLDDLTALMASDPAQALTIDELKQAISRVEQAFARTHVVSEKSLDQRI